MSERILSSRASFSNSLDEQHTGLVARERPQHVDNIQDPDAFSPEPEYSPEEEAEMQAQYLARLAELSERFPAPPAGWHDAPCCKCYAAMLVRDGTQGPILCSGCEADEVAAEVAGAVAV